MRLIGLPSHRGRGTSPRGRLFFAVTLLAAAAGCDKAPPPASAPPPSEVEVITVVATNVPVYEEWIGSLDGSTNAQIRAQVSGYLVAQKYKEGGFVHQGDLLFQIDKRVFKAALNQAQAQLDVALAQLRKTELDTNRLTPLAKQNAISQEELDDAVQANLAAKANVEAAKANLAQSQLNLEFTDVRSLIDGIAGTAQAQIGDLVGPSSGVLTTVSTVDPIRAYFNIREQSYLAFCRQFTNAEERRAYRSGMELQLILSDGSPYALPGTWFFTSRQVDVNTGTLQIAALFPNPDNILRPGQYAHVRAKTETRRDAILVPQRAVTELQGSYQVAVVDDTNTAHLKTVQVGRQIGNDWLIEKGVEPGDRVVVEGTQKVRSGTVVVPRPYAPEAKKP
ncbi:MAG: efflux RND transporter periplasmic adaptor subunit [Verrucomicrobiota bacterium]|jgi:membrane fusion protein (multidrug efflux system)